MTIETTQNNFFEKKNILTRLVGWKEEEIPYRLENDSDINSIN